MTPTELTAARQLIGLTQTEAAEHIGCVTKRSWNYFESGHRTIKPDVVEKMNALLTRRRKVLETALDKASGVEIAGVAVIYYPTPEYCGGVVDWRFSQSLARQLWADYGAKLVRFDPENYRQWLSEKQIKDSEQARASWAAQKKD